MNIRELQAFHSAYEFGSMTKAAERAYVSRQAFGKAVRSLENELGAPLFDRVADGIRPTELGRAIYPHVDRILDELRAINNDARRFAAGSSGSLIMAVEPNALMTLPIDLLVSYRSERPNLSLTTMAAYGSASLDMLASGTVDLVISVPMDTENFCYEPLLRSHLFVVTLYSLINQSYASTAPSTALQPSSSETPEAVTAEKGYTQDAGNGFAPANPTLHAARPPLEALQGLTLFGVGAENPIEAQVGDFLRSHGIEHRIAYDYPSAMLAVDAMRRGLGGCFVEESGLVQFDQAEYALVALDGDEAPLWEVGVTYRRASSKEPMIEDFIAFVRKSE